MPLVHGSGRRGPVVIAEAIDTGTRIGWAIVAWIAVGAAVLTVCLFTVVLTGAWAVRGAWRAVRRDRTRSLPASQPPKAPDFTPTAAKPTAPAWARHDHEREAA
jgi:hypothetical protein